MVLFNQQNKKIIIYGINMQAEQLLVYLEAEDVKVEAFCVDKAYYKTAVLRGKPVICFEDIEDEYPPDEYAIILSFGYKNMILNREEKFIICKNKGYEIPSFISRDAKVYTSDIGEGVIIYPNTCIAPFVEIGKGCYFETSCTIAHHSRIGNFNFFAPGVTTGGAVLIENNCFFGISSVIASGKTIKSRTMVGAGVCLTADTDEGEAFRHSEAIKLSHKPEYYI